MNVVWRRLSSLRSRPPEGRLESLPHTELR